MSTQHRIAALTRWSRETDRNSATQPARQGLEAKFERQVDDADPEGRMSPTDRAKAIESARRAHFMAMADKRWKRAS